MTTEPMKHTPTPWTVRQTYSNGEPAAIVLHAGKIDIATLCIGNYEEEETDAAFIVRAVNAHDALVNALQVAASELSLLDRSGHGSSGTESALHTVNAALKLAEGKGG